MASRKLDLEAMVEEWARDYFTRKATRKEKKLLEKECVRWAIEWKRVVFDHGPTEYIPEPPTVGNGTPTALVLFTANFTNKTSSVQRYTFKAERSTRSTCSLDVERGYSLGTETNVKLATPCKIAQASVGFKEELSLATAEGHTIEQELSWGTSSDIEVDPRSKAEAKLIIDEEEYKGCFQMTTRISGRIKVNFRNANDNNNFIKAVEGDIVDIASQAHALGHVNLDKYGVTIVGRALECTTAGNVHFRYGLKQTVEVDQVPYVD